MKLLCLSCCSHTSLQHDSSLSNTQHNTNFTQELWFRSVLDYYYQVYELLYQLKSAKLEIFASFRMTFSFSVSQVIGYLVVMVQGNWTFCWLLKMFQHHPSSFFSFDLELKKLYWCQSLSLGTVLYICIFLCCGSSSASVSLWEDSTHAWRNSRVLKVLEVQCEDMC